jgi:hypothetical protein
MPHLLCLALALPLADAKPDFTITAEELTKAYKEARGKPTKYQAKIIEVTGTFHVRRPGSPGDVLLRGHIEGITPNLVSCTPNAATAPLHQRLYGLARGQKLTFRGKEAGNKFSPVLADCELVSVGPCPAQTVTVAKLAGLKRTPAAARMLEGKAVLARVRIVDIDKKEKGRVTYTVADFNNRSKKPTTIKVVVDTLFDRDRTNELHAIKTGETWYALGVGDNLTSTPRLKDAVLLKEAPKGVKK